MRRPRVPQRLNVVAHIMVRPGRSRHTSRGLLYVCGAVGFRHLDGVSGKVDAVRTDERERRRRMGGRSLHVEIKRVWTVETRLGSWWGGPRLMAWCAVTMRRTARGG